MFKKLICLFAMLCLLFTMTACFDSGNSDNDTQETTKTATNSVTDTSVTTTEASTTNTGDGETGGFSQGLLFAESDYGSTTGYTVVGIGTCTDTNVKLPDTYKHPLMNKEYPVIEIADEAFKNCSNIKSIVIPDSVKKIGNRALMGCSSLESITTPFLGGGIYADDVLGLLFGSQQYNGSVAVEQYTMHGFNSKNQMETYYIPSSLRSVTVTKAAYLYGAFSNCNFLTSVTLCTTADAHTSLGAYAFYGCTGLTTVTLSSKITSIGDYAFNGCTALKSVNFSSATSFPMLKEIGDRAFYGCTSIEYFTLTNLVEKIGDSAFGGCSSLLSMAIPSTVKYVGSRAFDNGCTSLTAIQVAKRRTDCSEWESDWNTSSATPTYNG